MPKYKKLCSCCKTITYISHTETEDFKSIDKCPICIKSCSNSDVCQYMIFLTLYSNKHKLKGILDCNSK